MLQAAQEMLPEAELNLTSAQKAYEGVSEKYRAGKERIAEVSIVHRQLVSARLRYSDIKTRLFVATANLAFATGTLAPPRILYETSHCTRY
jgi:outer membrane protein TolC